MVRQNPLEPLAIALQMQENLQLRRHLNGEFTVI
jgi:hypothetical protein